MPRVRTLSVTSYPETGLLIVKGACSLLRDWMMGAQAHGLPRQEIRPASLLRGLRPRWPREAAETLRLSPTVIAAIWFAMWREFEAPPWTGRTVIFATLAIRAASIRTSLWRAVATMVGVAIALMANFAQAILAFKAALALWLALLTATSRIGSGQCATASS